MTDKKLTIAERVEILEAEIKQIKEEAKAMRDTQTEQGLLLTTVHDDTQEIVAILKGAKGGAAFIKKHGPRLFSFILGAASVFGLIETDTAKALTALIS